MAVRVIGGTMTHRIAEPSPDRGRRPPATVPHPRPRRAGVFAWAVLAQLAIGLLLGAPARPTASVHAPGIRPRDAVEVGLPHRRGDVTRELAPRVSHASQTRAGSGGAPFTAAHGWKLAAVSPSTPPAEAAAPDPRSARRPAFYANAPPLSGRPST